MANSKWGRVLNRRTFGIAAAAGVGGLLLGNRPKAPAPRPAPPNAPNLLYIMTDQQHANMLSSAGHPYVRTPAMDSLAADGIRFARAYCSNPTCLPSRVSMMTSRMPMRFGAEANRVKQPVDLSQSQLDAMLGNVFRGAGYETAYGGKQHWLAKMSPASVGFELLTEDAREELAAACVKFLQRPHRQPFLLVASFINPHDICFFPGARPERDESDFGNAATRTVEEVMKMAPGVEMHEFVSRYCPPSPENFDVSAGEIYVSEQCRDIRMTWTEDRWRLHRYVYAKLTERVDSHIAKVLTALRETGLDENTVIVFSSDHGEMDGAHRLVRKSQFYEEAARVPLIISRKGLPGAGRVDGEHLVASGLDLLPTLCDFAGIEAPGGLSGRSLRGLVETGEASDWREAVYLQSSNGRMVRSGRYKYSVHSVEGNREQLLDLEADPGEMKNVADDPACREALDQHRELMREWVASEHDERAEQYLVRAT